MIFGLELIYKLVEIILLRKKKEKRLLMYITLVCCDVRANFTFQGKKERGKKKSGFLVSFYTLLRPDWFENKKRISFTL